MKIDDLDRNKNVQLSPFWVKKLDLLVRWILLILTELQQIFTL